MAAVAVGAAGSLAGETLPRVCRSHRESSGDNSHWPPPPGAARLSARGRPEGTSDAAGGGRSRGGAEPGRGRGRGGGGAGIPARPVATADATRPGERRARSTWGLQPGCWLW